MVMIIHFLKTRLELGNVVNHDFAITWDELVFFGAENRYLVSDQQK